jgi:hypothetical protein
LFEKTVSRDLSGNTRLEKRNFVRSRGIVLFCKKVNSFFGVELVFFFARRNYVAAQNRENAKHSAPPSQVADILAVCLAALQPLTLVQIYQAVAALAVDPSPLSWDEFLGRYQLLAGFLVQRRDESVCLFHPLFREWLIRRGEFFFITPFFLSLF